MSTEIRAALEGERVPDYRAAHILVQKARGKAIEHACVDCSKQANDWSYDHADPAELLSPNGRPYSLDAAHYAPRCRSCHIKLDRWSTPATHCQRDHAFTAENTYRGSDGRRRCKTCSDACRARYDAKRVRIRQPLTPEQRAFKTARQRELRAASAVTTYAPKASPWEDA